MGAPIMTGGAWTALTVVAAVGSGLVGGVLYAFSAFVMRGLGDLEPAASVAAMQAINRAAPRGPLMIPLAGTALACLVLGVVAARHTGEPGGWLVLAGCALYLVAFAITGAYHVPRNNALVAVDPAGPRAAQAWGEYAAGWTTWNHARSAAALAGSALLAASLIT